MAINQKTEGDCGYVCFYNKNRYEVYAKDAWRAKQAIINHCKVPKSKQGLISVNVAERQDGSTVVHSTCF